MSELMEDLVEDLIIKLLERICKWELSTVRRLGFNVGGEWLRIKYLGVVAT
jgi:hypothetical protein